MTRNPETKVLARYFFEIAPKGKKTDSTEDWEKTFIKAHLPMVISIARAYRRPREISLMDVIQAGNLGLLEAAAEFFNKNSEEDFSQFAAPFIRAEIENLLQQFPSYSAKSSQEMVITFRIFPNLNHLSSLVQKVIDRIINKAIGELPSKKAIAKLRYYCNRKKPTAAEIRKRIQYLPPKLSLVLLLSLTNEEGEGWKTEDIADLLGISPQEVEKIQEKAVYRLVSNRKTVAQQD